MGNAKKYTYLKRKAIIVINASNVIEEMKRNFFIVKNVKIVMFKLMRKNNYSYRIIVKEYILEKKEKNLDVKIKIVEIFISLI